MTRQDLGAGSVPPVFPQEEMPVSRRIHKMKNGGIFRPDGRERGSHGITRRGDYKPWRKER